MKKILIGFIVFGMIGCAAVKQSKIDATDCFKDPACREDAVAIADNVKAEVVAVVGVSPLPLSTNVVGGIAYGVALILALIKLGKNKREEVPA
ncbi:hypothetical protein KW791_00630 [Candidatus Parcubacteria bacterium]|nr:hypothetical protein [Candidatus Parcubacteria bacterium]